MNPYLSDIADIPDFFANKAGVLLEAETVSLSQCQRVCSFEPGHAAIPY